MKANTPVERLYNGIIKENPTFVLMLGMCPTLAVNLPHPGHLYHGVQRHWYGPGGHLCAAVLQRGHLRPEKGHSRWGADACLYCGGGFFCDHRSVPFAGLYSRPL